MKPLFFTQHAQDAIDERELESAWIERTVRYPEWSSARSVRRSGIAKQTGQISELAAALLPPSFPR
jgi:hypothetical protein